MAADRVGRSLHLDRGWHRKGGRRDDIDDGRYAARDEAAGGDGGVRHGARAGGGGGRWRWRLGAHSDGSGPGSVASVERPANTAVARSDGPVLPDQEVFQGWQGRAPSVVGGEDASVPPAGRRLIYLVDSQEEASFLREFTAQINALRASYGQQPDQMVVMVFDSADDEGQAAQVIAADYYLSIVGGLPQSRVFDLRAR